MSDDDAQLNEARRLAVSKRAQARTLLDIGLTTPDPLLVFALFGAALERAKDTAGRSEYPRLQVRDGVDEDGEPGPVLVCPHCGLEQDGDIASVDVSERWTYGFADPETKALVFDYDDNHNEGIGYVHDPCGLPVSLPEGWTEA